ncbi:MAG: hypothetical protein LBP34_07420 [Flavobacteriaceae bacterium]|nr:hypothetical protein [Flavobacteriaceae bacterium]
MKISLRCSIKDDSIQIEFKNLIGAEIELYKPCTTNTFIHVINRGKELQQAIKFKAYCKDEKFKLLKNESSNSPYPYKIIDLYNLEKGENYEIFVEHVIYNKGKIQQKIVSDIHKFQW